MLQFLLKERRARLVFIDRHCSHMISKKTRKIVQLRAELIRRLIPLVIEATEARVKLSCVERLEESRDYAETKPKDQALETSTDYINILEKMNMLSLGGTAANRMKPSFVLHMARVVLFASPEHICGDRYIVTEILDKDTPVYEAVDVFTKSHVAIKVLRPGHSTIEEIKLTRLASGLSSTFIKFIAVETAPADSRKPGLQNRLALVLERCSNSLFSLNNQMAESKNPCPVELFRAIFLPVCRALKLLHEAGFMHCDLKMDNILFNNSESRIIDFGLAMQIGSDSRRGSLFTIGHIPPELAFSGKDSLSLYPSADIFALGVTMLRVALPSAGELFGTTTKASYDRGRTRIAKYLRRISDDVSTELANFILPLLDYNPDCRPSAAELASSPFLLGGWPSALDNRPGTVCLPCFDFCTDYCESAPEALERFMRIGTVEEPATLDVASFLRNVPDTPDLVTQYCCLVENQVVFEQPASFFPETKYFC